MRVYSRLFYNSFRSNFVYKFDALFKILQEVVYIVVQAAVWTALYQWNGVTEMDGITLNTMINYVILSSGITVLVKLDAINFIDREIRTGAIATDFIKPLNFQMYTFFICFGTNIYQFIFRFIPLLIVFVPFYGMYLPKIYTAVLFLLALLGSILIYFFLSYAIGMIGFWYFSIWHLERVLSDIIRLLAGSVVPLWFFSGALYDIAMYLPFRFIYYMPISVFLERVQGTELGWMLFQQWIWVGLLFFLTKVIWYKGQSKLVVQGG